MGSLTFATLPDDFTEEEKQMLIKYVDNGVPGITKVSESDIFQWFTMYMAGKTFTEISVACKVSKDKVLFIAHKSNWLEKRMKHFSDIVSNLQEKVNSAKLESANTVATIISSFNKYYNDTFTKFLATNDKSIIEGLDTKLLSQYQKAIESLEKIIGSSADKDKDGKPKHPLVNINMNSGTMKENEDGSVDISGDLDNKSLGDILKLLAEAKKANDPGGQE